MKLYIYDHCPFCCRARMVFGLKGEPIPLQVVHEDDAETLIARVGKKSVPVLEKDDGSFMLESMDIVRYIDERYPLPALAPVESAIEEWCDRTWSSILQLSIPRFTRSDFPELATPSARKAYTRRETVAFGDLDALIDQTPSLLASLEPDLNRLEPLLPPTRAIGLSDFRLYPALRMLSIVRGPVLGPRARVYLADMEDRTGVPLHTSQAV